MTRVETHALVIPVEGDPHRVEVMANAGMSLVWAIGLLAEYGGTTNELAIHLDVKGRRVGTVLFTHQPDGPVNPRARAAVTHLMGGAKFTFRGPVLLADLTRDSADEIETLIGTM